jgi:hypothetical protein
MKHASFMVFDSPGQREAVRPDTQRLDRTPRKSARAICLFPEAVGKVLHMRVAQMGDEVRRVTDGYQHRRIVRAANFDVPKPIGIGSVRLDRLNIRARDPMLPKHMGFAAKRRHFIFHVAYVQRPRAGKAGVYESIGLRTSSAHSHRPLKRMADRRRLHSRSSRRSLSRERS